VTVARVDFAPMEPLAPLPRSGAALLYFQRTVNVPKSRRERLLRACLGIAVRPSDVSLDDPLTALLLEVVRTEVVRGSSIDGLRWIVLDDVDQSGRRRLLAFLFEGDSAAPFAVAKAQNDAVNGSLAAEADALRRLHELLPPPLRATVPAVMHYVTAPRGEVLVSSALRGRSAYADMQSSLVPSRLIDAHFRAAARWLSAFHEATRQSDDVAALHGDYWAHNVLRSEDCVAVVDWEHFAPAAPRAIDLFHYPLTYGVNYPWSAYRLADPEVAFARTFIERTRLSRAVRGYLETYASRTRTPAGKLAGAFREFLATRGTMTPGGEAHAGTRALPWPRFLERFESATDSVFS
jgi:hypothetical protein